MKFKSLQIFFVITALITLISSCEDNPSGPGYTPGKIVIQTDTSYYVIGNGFEFSSISVTITNGFNDNIYFGNKVTTYVEEFKSDTLFKSVKIPNSFAMRPSLIKPHLSTDIFKYSSPLIYKIRDQFEFNSSVKYRLRFDIYIDEDCTLLFDYENLVSNSFVIVSE